MSMFEFWKPPTPEETAAYERKLLATVKASLAHVQEARRQLREVRALGLSHCSDDFYRAQKYLALMEDGLENILAAPSRLDR